MMPVRAGYLFSIFGVGPLSAYSIEKLRMVDRQIARRRVQSNLPVRLRF